MVVGGDSVDDVGGVSVDWAGGDGSVDDIGGVSVDWAGEDDSVTSDACGVLVERGVDPEPGDDMLLPKQPDKLAIATTSRRNRRRVRSIEICFCSSLINLYGSLHICCFHMIYIVLINLLCII